MSSTVPMDPVGFGPYVLVELLGRGGMAEVLRAKSIGAAGFSKDVAIKRILPAYANDDEFVGMFVDEARTMVSLNHPNVVEVYDLGELDGYYFMAMEFIFGKDLLDLLAASSRMRRRVPRDIVLHVISETLRGLSFVHQATDVYGQPLQIVHRDVSPSNVMLSYSGNVKLGDFGIAKSRLQSRMTEAGTQKGKLGYMSPEQALGEPLDARSDLFAVGVLLYECLTMSRLFRANDELEAMKVIQESDIEPALERRQTFLDEDTSAILRRALARQPDERYPDARTFAEAIDALRAREGLMVGPDRLGSFLQEVFAEDHSQEMETRRREDPKVRSFIDVLKAQEGALFEYRRKDGPVLGPVGLKEMEAILERSDEPTAFSIRHPGESFRPPEEFRVLVHALRRQRQRLSGAHMAMEDEEPSAANHPLHRQQSGFSFETARPVPGSSPARGTPTPVAVARFQEAETRRSLMDTPVGSKSAMMELRTDSAVFRDGKRVRGSGEPPDDGPRDDEPRNDRGEGESSSVTVHGDFASVSFPRLLEHLSRGRRTGTLNVSHDDTSRRIFLRDGQIVQATTCAPEELLGAVAVSRGLLDEEGLERALALARTRGQRLGEVLANTTEITPHLVYEMCMAQLRQKVRASFSAGSGNWTWTDGPYDWMDDIEVPLPTLNSALEGIREDVRESLLTRFVEIWGSSPMHAGVRSAGDSGVALKPRELRGMQAFRDGQTPLEFIAQLEANRREDDILPARLLYLGCELGFFRLADRPLMPGILNETEVSDEG